VRITPRKKLFVDSAVQGTLLLRIVVYWCFSVFAVCLFMLCARALVTPGESFTDYFAFGEFFAKHGTVVLASALLVPLIMVDVLVVSNRFVGPLFRLRRSMRNLAAGETVRRIEFRQKDYWHDLSHEFNAISEYIEDLQRQLAEAQAKAGEPRDLQSAVHE
jgi:methyl-accepting chemotaxis protein